MILLLILKFYYYSRKIIIVLKQMISIVILVSIWIIVVCYRTNIEFIRIQLLITYCVLLDSSTKAIHSKQVLYSSCSLQLLWSIIIQVSPLILLLISLVYKLYHTIAHGRKKLIYTPRATHEARAAAAPQLVAISPFILS